MGDLLHDQMQRKQVPAGEVRGLRGQEMRKNQMVFGRVGVQFRGDHHVAGGHQDPSEFTAILR